jgi:hypothetical protein
LADCLVIDPTPQEKTGCMISVLIATALLILAFFAAIVFFVFAIASASH